MKSKTRLIISTKILVPRWNEKLSYAQTWYKYSPAKPPHIEAMMGSATQKISIKRSLLLVMLFIVLKGSNTLALSDP